MCLPVIDRDAAAAVLQGDVVFLFDLNLSEPVKRQFHRKAELLIDIQHGA